MQAALGDAVRRRQPRCECFEPVGVDMQRTQVAGVDADEQLGAGGPGGIGRLCQQRRHSRQVFRVETLEQHEHAIGKRRVEHPVKNVVRQHGDDQQHAARAGTARLQNLDRVHEEVFPHDRRVGHGRGNLFEVLEATRKTGRFGEHRYRRRPAGRVLPGPLRAIALRCSEVTFGR